MNIKILLKKYISEASPRGIQGVSLILEIESSNFWLMSEKAI
ncbi:hypothetical protein [Nostoc sp. FACHB-110]|nr:hypothetical protein [Nostoc sp. FACHB-110]